MDMCASSPRGFGSRKGISMVSLGGTPPRRSGTGSRPFQLSTVMVMDELVPAAGAAVGSDAPEVVGALEQDDDTGCPASAQKC